MVTLFETEIQKLNKRITDAYKSHETPNRRLILDGLVDVKAYIDCNLKIMWILKEPRDGADSTGGGWSIVENIRDFRSEGLNRDTPLTFLPIIYTSYALQNGIKRFDQLDLRQVYTNYCQSLKKIAYINIQKLPAKSTSKDSEITHAYEKHKELILDQIKTLRPDFIICCAGSTIHQKLAKDLPQDFLKTTQLRFCYHPAQRKMKRENYIREILDDYFKK